MRRKFPKTSAVVAAIILALGVTTWFVETRESVEKVLVWLHLVEPKVDHVVVYERTILFQPDGSLDRVSSTVVTAAAADLRDHPGYRVTFKAEMLSAQVARAQGGGHVVADDSDYRVKALVPVFVQHGVARNRLEFEYSQSHGTFPNTDHVTLVVRKPAVE